MKKIAIISTIILLSALMLPLIFPAMQADKAAATVSYADVYVDAARPDDSGNGSSWATAKKYIQSGIDIVSTGGTVHVAAGTYNEYNIHISQSFNLVGAGARTTIIDGGGLGQVLCIASYVGQANTISGFTIQNGHVGWPDSDEVNVQGAGPGMPVGGGVYVALHHVVIMNDCTIRDNMSDFMGGGIYNAGELSLNRCTLSGNTAGSYGGGIANFVDGPNPAPSPIAVSNGKMTLTNCTISGNSVKRPSVKFPAASDAAIFRVPLMLGGGVFNGGVADFINVTIANNSVLDFKGMPETNISGPVLDMAHGGGFANMPLQCTNPNNGPVIANSTVATFKNTLVAGNIPENGYNDKGIVTSHGYNLDSQNNCGFNKPTDQVNTNPLLGALQNNGGPTSTCAITASSPAFNRGTGAGAPSTDQRGVTRPQGGGYDIGAYECIPPPPEPEKLIGTGGQSSSPGVAVGTYGYSPPVSLPVIQTQSASISAKVVTPGTPITVTADITNKSTVNGNKKVTLYVNGQVESTQPVTVNSGGSSKLTFNVSRSEPGDYSVYVDGVSAGSFKVELFRESDGVLILSVTLVAIAFILGMVMLGRRQRTGY